MILKTIKNVSILDGGLKYKVSVEGGIRVSGQAITDLYREHFTSLIDSHKLSYSDAMQREVHYEEEIDEDEEIGKITLTTRELADDKDSVPGFEHHSSMCYSNSGSNVCS